MQYGLLGRHLSHSYSPQIHRQLASYDYKLFEVEPEDLYDFLDSNRYCGLNVTIPYKKTVAAYCDELSDEAKKLGSVNTVVRKNGKLYGYNTDYYGFRSMLMQSRLNVAGKKVLILGSGGASVTANAVLQEAGAYVITVSRTGENNYTNIYNHADSYLIVNATPVGMYPDNGTSPVDLNNFPHLAGVLDMIYNPARTQLLIDAENKGLITQNGLWMLVAQAKQSAQIFTQAEIPDSKIASIHNLLRNQMENIILIGMPGCGKSTIGKLLADKLNRRFVDIDSEIEKNAALSIPEIFALSGEDTFRSIESNVLSESGKQSGLVISTGGGCVTRPHNYSLLHQNGKIIWLTRNIEMLPTQGRPLSQTTPLSKMYHIRKPLYEAFADFTVSNDESPDITVSKILDKLNIEV